MGKVKEFCSAITSFVFAQKEFKLREKELDEQIQPLLVKYRDEKNIDKLEDLIDQLPKDYRGIRRIYQAILEIEEGEQ